VTNPTLIPPFDGTANGAIRRAAAELMGSILLTALVVGSGIAAARLSPGDTGLELLENAIATAFGLFAIILIFDQVSGAHFNPVISLVDVALGLRRWHDLAIYLPAQIVGCVLGAILANVMFDLPAVTISETVRMTGPHFLAEIVATAGLVLVVFGLARSGRSALAAPAVGAYIGAAYFFTSSASFANPAITIARMFSDTFAGIAPASAVGYVGAQLIGAMVGFLLVKLFFPAATRRLERTVPTVQPRSQGVEFLQEQK
jgi:glycerol uptake facilitator-like aquaporin